MGYLCAFIIIKKKNNNNNKNIYIYKYICYICKKKKIYISNFNICSEILNDCLYVIFLRKVWRYQRGNQKILNQRKTENTMVKRDKGDIKRNITEKTEDWATRISLKAGGEFTIGTIILLLLKIRWQVIK